MRQHIEHLNSSDMEWTPISDGVSCKMLNHNEETGDRTALFSFDPSKNAAPPNVCHYHSVYEEIFILDGKMTFDHKIWLKEYGYVFHPPFAVHGFNSAVPVLTTFLARAPADLDFNFPDAPNADAPFFVDGKTASRDVTYMNPPDEQSWTPLAGPDGKILGRRLILNEDRETGEGSSLIRFDAGVSVAARPEGYAGFNEAFILSGRVSCEGGPDWAEGDYWHRHPKTAVPALEIVESALIFTSVGPS